jgi:hypothetical protein
MILISICDVERTKRYPGAPLPGDETSGITEGRRHE